MPHRFIRTIAATAVLVALGVAGFFQLSNGDEPTAAEIVALVDEPTESSGPPSTSSTTTAPPIEEVVEPFVYSIGILEGVSTENFWAYFGSSPTVWDAYVLAPTKASLYRVDPESLEIEPEIAGALADPTWNAEGWRVKVQLRGDMSWSDGTQVTAHDLAFTYATVRELQLGGQWADVFPAEILSLSALDSYTVEIKFSSRPSLNVWPYSAGTAPIMARHYWEPKMESVVDAAGLYALAGAEDVAGGPMDVVQVDGDRVVSRANPGYRGNQAADVVEYRVYASEELMVQGMDAGEVDVLVSPKGLSVNQTEHLSGVEGVTTITSPKFGVRYLGFNLMREPMNRIEFRQAVAFLVDRPTLASEVAKAPLALNMLPEGATPWYDEEAAAEINNAAAGDLTTGLAAVVTALKSQGYSWSVEPSVADGAIVAGSELKIGGRPPAALTILTAGDLYDPARPEYAEKIALAIELLGFKVIPVPTDFATVVDLAYTPGEDGKLHYDMALLGWSLGNPGVPSFYSDLFSSTGGANNTGYSSKAMDDLISRLETAKDAATAKDLMWRIEALIASDIAYLPLYASQITEAYRSDSVSFGGREFYGGLQAALGGIEFVDQEG